MDDNTNSPAERLREQKGRVETLRSQTEDEDIEQKLQEIQGEIKTKIKQANDPERPDPRIADIEMIKMDINEVERDIKRKQGDNLRERKIDWDDSNQGIGGR